MIYFDVTETLQSGLNTGIQRVVRHLASESIEQGLEEQLSIQLIAMNPRTRKFEVIPPENFSEQRSALDLTGTNQFINLLRKIRPLVSTLKNLLPDNIFQFLRNRFLLIRNGKDGLISEIFSDLCVKFFPGDLIFIADSFWNNSYLVKLILSSKAEGANLHIFVHDVLPITSPSYFEKSSVKSFQLNFTPVVKAADQIYTSSHHVRESVLRLFPEVDSVEVIDLGSNLVPLNSQYDLRENNVNQNIMLAIGTIEPRKNYGQILDWLSTTSLDVQFFVIGRPGWKSSKLLRRLKRSKNVTLLGALTDNEMMAVLQKVKFGVCASFDEGYGLPLREFLTLGIPVVASDIPPFREIIDASNVFYFDLQDNHSLENAVIGAIQSTNNTKVLFPTWEDSAKQILKLLQVSPEKN